MRASLFNATFRALPPERTVALARAVASLSPGSQGVGSMDWSGPLGRHVGVEEGRALGELYGRLMGAARRRVTARVDTPGPVHEVASQRLAVDGDAFDLSFAGDEQLYTLRRAGGRLLLRRSRLVAFGIAPDEHEVLEGLEVTAPLLVGSAGGAFVAGVDADGLLHASFSAGGGQLVASKKRVGRGVAVAAACEHASGLAVFLDASGRALIFGRDGRFSREKKLGPGLEVVSAASQGGGELVALARRARGCELVRLDSDLRVQGAGASVPYLRAPADAKVAWITPDLVLVVEPPDVAYAFGADDRRLHWTARLADPLDDLAPAVSEALELVAFGRIEGEWGEAAADVGVARWTRDGLGRHGPTVRLETAPGTELGALRVATRGELVAVAYREGGELVERLLVMVPLPASHPAPAEWVFAAEAE